MLRLDRVTLCCIDCVNHDLAIAALSQCVNKCEFARIVFVTDREFELAGVDVITIPALASRGDYSRFVIKELRHHIATDFVLLVQWDGFVVNPEAWSDDFLDYDYVGARWGWLDDTQNIGNGGFSLRSRRLLEALADPHVSDYELEDVAIGRTYRAYLENAHRIRFPPAAMADLFSVEASYVASLPFGFHGLFNFWMFFRKPELEVFLGMATRTILDSAQCLQLARNYAEVGRRDEARLVLQRILDAHPARDDAKAVLARLDLAPAQVVGRNDLCPCGSGKRYKVCHGRLGGNAAPMATGGMAPLLQRALAEHQRGQLYPAEALYRQVLQAEPANPIARHYLGVIAYQQLRFEDARDMLEEARPGNESVPDYHNNLGLVWRKLGNLSQAIACFGHALALKADYAGARNNLAMALQDERRHDEALAEFDRAIALRPDFADAHWNRALLYLLRGDYARGWPEYEWRLRHPQLGLQLQREFVQPRWDGSDPRGRTILLYAEQGYGDALQFVRYAQVLQRRGARVIVEAPPALQRLFSEMEGIEIIASGSSPPAFEVQAPLLSVPHLLGASFETLPVPVPYLRAPVRDAAAWRERLVPVEGSRVGLVWTGSLKNQPGRYRTCPPESFRVLAGLPGVTFYSLQKDLPEGAAPPPLRMLDFTSELADFAATAALMENLDLIVTVDTAVAHLAGALGRPVWLMLPYERDWRWLAHGETSPWYPTMRLFPQEGRGDWDGVLARVADAMGAFQVKGAK